MLLHVKRAMTYLYIYKPLPEDEPSSSKYVEDKKKLKFIIIIIIMFRKD